MDIQLRKVHFVKEFLRLENEQAIEKLEALLRSEKKRLYSQDPKPMYVDELDAAIDKAEQDSTEGRVTNAQNLKKDIQSWS